MKVKARHINLQHTAKSVLMGKFIVIKSYIKREERSQIYNSFLQFKELEKGGQTNPKLAEYAKINIRAERNQMKI